MIGLSPFRRWATLAVFALVGTAALSFFPAHSAFAANGSISGGKYTVDIKGTAVPLEKENTTISLTPTPPGFSANSYDINDGNIKINNVPEGTYTVTINFKFTKDLCSKNWAIKLLSGATPALSAFCKSTTVGDVNYALSKTFNNVVVQGGQNTTLNPKDGSLGAAIHVDANGNPILDCSGKGIIMSFIICPMISNILGIINWVIEGFIQPYLAINPLTTTIDGKPSELYQIWNNIRNFANIVFIGAFFAVIFSQATSIGISNYGVKKLLPRLILIGIGTNISFFICAFLIDVFNVLGVGVGSLLVSGVTNGSLTLNFGNADLIGFLAIPALVSPIGPLIAAAGAAIIFGAFAFLFIVAVIFFITAVVIIIRQIVIIFLVIVSPVAFVAGLLPNTQNFFNQWFKLFIRLLAMYPIIMILFAAGKIASVVMQKIGGGGG